MSSNPNSIAHSHSPNSTSNSSTSHSSGKRNPSRGWPDPNYVGSDSHHPPRPIAELVKLAKLPFDPNLPIKAYIKSAAVLYQQATSLLAENQLELAFVYLLRASTIIIDDLPANHRDYPLLPPTFKGQLQADGLKYMDALVPLKSTLANRHSEFLHRSPPLSIPNKPNSHSPPKPDRAHHARPLQRPPNVTRTSSSTTLHSSSTAPTSTGSPLPFKSSHSIPTRFPPSRSTHTHFHHHPQHSSPSTPPSSIPSYSSLDHCPDWELVEQPVPEHPPRLQKKPPPRPTRPPSDWPVELGGGHGTRMSVALPQTSIPSTNVPPHLFPPQLAHSTGLPHAPYHPPPTRPLPDHPPRPPLSSSSRSTRDSRRLSEAYTEIERILSRDSSQPHSSLPPAISSPPTASDLYSGPRPKLPRMSMSTDNLVHPQHPSSSDSRAPPFSGFKALISRPRRSSLSTPSKPALKPSPPFSPVAQSPEISPPGYPMQPQIRRGSYDPSTWRWLKALAPKLTSHHHPAQPDQPLQNDLYAEPSPATDAQHVLVQPLRDFSMPGSSSSGHRAPVGSSGSRTGAPKKPPSHPLSALSRRGHNASAPHLVPHPPSLPPAPPPVPPKEPGMRFKPVKAAPTRTDGLRDMVCPEELVGTFMEIARPETERGVELCGLLLGKLVGERELVVTTLMVPKQVSKPDSCGTTDEEEVFEYQSKHGLMTLGWIHTHPTQTCFMSSVDLHTHCSYQLMLAEAVAIVCSPNKSPCVGVFRLTDPPGIQVIRSCQERDSSSFHVHPAGMAIYTDADGCDGNGHFRMIKNKSKNNKKHDHHQHNNGSSSSRSNGLGGGGGGFKRDDDDGLEIIDLRSTRVR